MAESHQPLTPEVLAPPAPETPTAESDFLRIVEPHTRELVETAIVMAKAGDPTSMKLLWDRFWPARSGSTIKINLGKIRSATDARERMAEVLEAAARGQLTTTEAEAMVNMLRVCFAAHTHSDMLPFESAPAIQVDDARQSLRNRILKAIAAKKQNADPSEDGPASNA